MKSIFVTLLTIAAVVLVALFLWRFRKATVEKAKQVAAIIKHGGDTTTNQGITVGEPNGPTTELVSEKGDKALSWGNGVFTETGVYSSPTFNK